MNGNKRGETMNKIIILITSIFISTMITAWIYYFYGLKYIKKKSFWYYTGIGPIIVRLNPQSTPEPGRTYFEISLYLFGISVFLFVFAIILLKLLGIL